MQSRIKTRKYFSAHQETLNIYDGGKNFYPKKQKDILRRDNLQISVPAVWRCTVKKVSLKLFPPAYLHIIKIDIK